MRERTSERAVTMITGVAVRLRILPQTSYPSWSGRPRSSSTTPKPGPSGTSAWSASSPLRAWVTSKPCRFRTADSAAATWLSSSTSSSLMPASSGSSGIRSDSLKQAFGSPVGRTRAHACVHHGSHADGRGRRQEGSGCTGAPLSARYARRSQVLRHVSDCYRIVMLRFPSDVMTLVAAGHYCPPKPRRTEHQSDDRSIGDQGRRGRER